MKFISLFRILTGSAFLLAAAAQAQTLTNGAVVLNPVGCNAVSLAQIPGVPELFIGRQLLTADGKIAGITGPNDCSGGDPANQKTGKSFNRWALTLTKLDWASHKLTLVKPLLDTSEDPATKVSKAMITWGPLKGAIIRSAYDPSVVKFHGRIWVAYECTLENGVSYGVDGTSSCVSSYDTQAQALDLGKTLVLVSGVHRSASEFTAAAVPQLFAYQNRLFVYFSSLAVTNGTFQSITVRGAEVVVDTNNVLSIKNARGVVHATDPATTEMWALNPADPMSNSAADARPVWNTQGGIVAAAGVGGSGCTAPGDASKGCFRLALSKVSDPIAKDAFSAGAGLDNASLPTNAEEYATPIKDPSGAYWLIGHFMRPKTNGFSDKNPTPDNSFWSQSKVGSVLAMFPLADKALWPVE